MQLTWFLHQLLHGAIAVPNFDPLDLVYLRVGEQNNSVVHLKAHLNHFQVDPGVRVKSDQRLAQSQGNRTLNEAEFFLMNIQVSFIRTLIVFRLN